MKDEDFTPEKLREFAYEIRGLRAEFIEIHTEGADPIAEQQFLLALSALGAAASHFEIASVYQSRALP